MSRKTDKFPKIIRGENCHLRRLEPGDERAELMLKSIFSERDIFPFLNSEYTSLTTKAKLRKWIASKVNNPVEVWYTIRSGRKCVGYICFKWRKHFDRACEISTGISKEYRNLKLGYESSKILLDYLLELGRFEFIVAYVHEKNKRAEGNIRKLGFAKSNRLHKIITTQFYGAPKDKCGKRIYQLFAVDCRK